MKVWDRDHFALAEVASLTPNMVVRERMDVAPADMTWMQSLPIAAAIYRKVDDRLLKLQSNDRFDRLTLSGGRQVGLDLAAVSDRITAMSLSGRTTHVEKWTSGDDVRKCQLDVSIASFGSASDHFLLSFVDRTAEAESQASLRREMLHDCLTGFSNRVGFEERVEESAAAYMVDVNASPGGQYAMILFDLARFSRINESVGVLAGDELIITVARRFQARLRQHEIVGRIGGDEFALFARISSTESVEAIAKRIEQAFAEPCKLSNLEIKVDCAAAAAIGTFGQDEPMETLRHAQLALKRAKKSKCFELFSDDKLTHAKNRFSIETDLRRALERNELELHYQPLIDLDSGKLNGFEALARWNHPDRGQVSPIDFIGVAEECGLIVPLGRWALIEAARTIAEWDQAAGQALPYRISVNLSAVQLKRDDVTEAVKVALDSASISGDRFTLELTESALVDDPQGARKILESLKQLDACLAMDDFGTGYSNLAYLQKLPIDVLKIDRSFISDMLGNRDSEAIVSTILSLASALGMKTTAEGIESQQISEALRGLGCNNGQGYYYSRPMTRDAAFQFLLDSVSTTA